MTRCAARCPVVISLPRPSSVHPLRASNQVTDVFTKLILARDMEYEGNTETIDIVAVIFLHRMQKQEVHEPWDADMIMR